LIGGYLTHYFKTKTQNELDIRAPNSKKLSLREPADIKGYLRKLQPDFIINAAIAAIDSDASLSFEVNYLGSINLARAALALNIPYIHISSAATLPAGENLPEEDSLPLNPDLSNYAKSKLMTERTLRYMHESHGLDYTMIRLSVVYGEHDHKIQGFHRLFFSIVNEAMPFILTKKGVRHSYSNAGKLPYFIHHLLENRDEFRGRTYHFVDPEPVELARLILTIKSYLDLSIPKGIYIPYPLAVMVKWTMEKVLRGLARIGVEARLPAELMFLEKFYKTQTLASLKLQSSSFTDPAPAETIYTHLPQLINYYLARWEHLNLITTFKDAFFDPQEKLSEEFLKSPRTLLESMHREHTAPFTDIRSRDGRQP